MRTLCDDTIKQVDLWPTHIANPCDKCNIKFSSFALRPEGSKSTSNVTFWQRNANIRMLNPGPSFTTSCNYQYVNSHKLSAQVTNPFHKWNIRFVLRQIDCDAFVESIDHTCCHHLSLPTNKSWGCTTAVSPWIHWLYSMLSAIKSGNSHGVPLPQSAPKTSIDHTCQSSRPTIIGMHYYNQPLNSLIIRCHQKVC